MPLQKIVLKTNLFAFLSVGVSDTATTVQVAVQTPPSRRRGTAKTQTKLVKKIKKYDFGLDIEHIDAKLRPQNNQIMPQGKFMIS